MVDKLTGSVFYRREDGALMEAQSFQNENGEVYTVDSLIELASASDGEEF